MDGDAEPFLAWASDTTAGDERVLALLDGLRRATTGADRGEKRFLGWTVGRAHTFD